jgi:hypothetical protein
MPRVIRYAAVAHLKKSSQSAEPRLSANQQTSQATIRARM